MRDPTRERLWKKYSMYEVLKDSNGEKPGGFNISSIEAIKRLSDVNIKRKDKYTVLFEREGHTMMCYLDVPDKKVPFLVTHLYASKDTPQDCIDQVLEEFRGELKVIYGELQQKGWELVLRMREEERKRIAKYNQKHLGRIEDLILD